MGEEVHDRLTTLKHEYVWDWEDDFEDIHEAYDEQGRGEAEVQLLTELVNESLKRLDLEGPDLSLDEMTQIKRNIAEHFSFEYNY